MATLEERVAYLEGQMAEQGHVFQAIRDALKGIDQRCDRIEQRIDRLEQRIDKRFDAIDRQFLWIVGIQITTLITVMAVVLSRG